jgi:hypothetical protein
VWGTESEMCILTMSNGARGAPTNLVYLVALTRSGRHELFTVYEECIAFCSMSRNIPP